MYLTPRSKAQEITATAKLVKETHNSLVYSSAFGQSLYFNKNVFDGQKPERITISVSWDTK